MIKDSIEFLKLPFYEKLAFSVFLFTSFHAAFQQPYLIMSQYEKANIFAGICCLTSLMLALPLVKEKSFAKREILFIILFAGFAIFSSFSSIEPVSSFIRNFVLLSSCAGAFCCARIFFREKLYLNIFTYICFGFLIAILFLSLFGFLLSGRINYLLCLNYGNISEYFKTPMSELSDQLDTFLHSWVDIIILLCFAPIFSLCKNKNLRFSFSAVIILCSIFILYLSKLRSILIMMSGAIAVIFLSGFVRFKYIILLFLLVILSIASFFYFFPEKNLRFSEYYEPVNYRLEGIPFSIHIASEHPFGGIGLTASRIPYLNDYEMTIKTSSKQAFTYSLKKINTADNIFLTLITGNGIPFFLLYAVTLFYFSILLLKLLKTDKSLLGILILFSCCVIHSFFYDSLLFPQVSWFFFILLGMIPLKK